MTWHDIWYDIYIYLTAIGLTPGGSSTSHIYTQIHILQRKENLGNCGPCPVCGLDGARPTQESNFCLCRLIELLSASKITVLYAISVKCVSINRVFLCSEARPQFLKLLSLIQKLFVIVTLCDRGDVCDRDAAFLWDSVSVWILAFGSKLSIWTRTTRDRESLIWQ
jgi:hypothetical protein